MEAKKKKTVPNSKTSTGTGTGKKKGETMSVTRDEEGSLFAGKEGSVHADPATGSTDFEAGLLFSRYFTNEGC